MASPFSFQPENGHPLLKRMMPPVAGSQLTRMLSLAANLPSRMALASGFSICCWIARFNGRAPNTGSKPALANSASLLGKPRAYLVFGVEDGTHAVVGTAFDPLAEVAKAGGPLLPLWLHLGLQPNVGFEIHAFSHHGQRVVLFEVFPAFDRPIKFYGTAYVRNGTSKTELARYPEKERALWNRRLDWSAQVCEQATLADLDPAAIAKARTEFATKTPGRPTRWPLGMTPRF